MQTGATESELEARLAVLTQAQDVARSTTLFRSFGLSEDLRAEFYSYLSERVTRKETFQALVYGGGAIVAYTTCFCLVLQRVPPVWFYWLLGLMLLAWLATSRAVRSHVARHRRSLPSTGGKRWLRGISPVDSGSVLEVLAVVGTLAAAGLIHKETSGSLGETLTRGVIYLVLLAFIGGVRKPRRVAMAAVGVGLLFFQLADAPWSPCSDLVRQLQGTEELGIPLVGDAVWRAWAAGASALFVGVFVTFGVSFRHRKMHLLYWLQHERLKVRKALEGMRLSAVIGATHKELHHACEAMGLGEDVAIALHTRILDAVRAEVPTASEALDQSLESERSA